MDDGNFEDYKKLIKKLDKDGFKFHAFATKSGRCRHIHMYDDKFFSFDKEKRRKIKEILINKYGCDNNLKIDEHMIPIEFVEHWKTGEKKDLIFTNKGDWFDI